ncbi:MAG: rhodanese-related sulfurtransferase [Gammaproteobacteria bacterium]
MTTIATAAPDADVEVASFYKFVELADPAALGAELADLARAQGLRGTVLLAHEGLNASVAGTPAAIAALLDLLRGRPGFAPLSDLRRARAARVPFRRFKVKLKNEIVTFGRPEAAPARGTGVHVAPADWNALVAAPDVLLIDTRNDYEVRLGTFTGARDLELERFRDFPARMQAALDASGAKRVAMFCTGGIRCEKASAWLVIQGVEVYQLAGGILRYLEEVPADRTRWQGDCFVFDERVAVGPDLLPADYVACHACRRPLSAADRASPLFIEHECCTFCHDAAQSARRAAHIERGRQMAAAASRGVTHLGAVMGTAQTADDAERAQRRLTDSR